MKIKTNLKELSGVAAGSFIVALSFNLFLIPNKIAAGGAGGLATVIHHLWGLPVGLTVLALNAPLFAAARRSLGTGYLWRSLWGMLLLSVFIDLQATHPFFSPWTQDPLLAAVFGGILAGVGLGVTFNSRGTTGGSELLALLLAGKLPFSLGTLVWLADGLVIVAAGLVFDIELALYAMISVFITGKVIDVIQEGPANSKALLIISDKYAELQQALPAATGRGLTALPSRGVYSQAARETILLVASVSQIPLVKKVVYGVDKNAFVIVFNAAEVLGEGFKKNRTL
ncbi:MAG: YitT family protein [Clostridiales bacterium]|nr:YitT family protein [Clostridiales bacterium]